MDRPTIAVLQERINAIAEALVKLEQVVEDQRKDKHERSGEIHKLINQLRLEVAQKDEKMRAIEESYVDVKNVLTANITTTTSIDKKITSLESAIATLTYVGGFLVGLFTILGVILEIKHI